ncbi:MAG: cysteine hydrolase family protein [Allosphingosinicella sp.]
MKQHDRIAALLIDFQEAFIGRNSPFNLLNTEQLVLLTRRLVTSLRKQAIPIIWTRVYLDDWAGSPYAEKWPQHFGADGKAIFLQRGSHSHAIVRGLRDLVEDRDILIDKPRYSAFIGTDLLARLQEMSIGEIFFAGVSTNVCVESTLRDAFQFGFRCKLIRECTLTFDAALQAASERIISMVFGEVVSLDEISAVGNAALKSNLVTAEA